MSDFSTIDNRCLGSWNNLISGQFKHRYPLNILCSKIFAGCKIKRMVTNLTQLGYVNNYDKNRYLENFSKAAVHVYDHYFQTSLSLKPLGRSKPNFMWSLQGKRKHKFCKNGHCHMTKMAATPICVKNL